jgi:hypothetical protein
VGKDGKAKLPRLVVEFAENVVKAKQQAEHRSLSSLILSSKRLTRAKQERRNRTKQSRGVSSSVRKTGNSEGGARMKRQDKR